MAFCLRLFYYRGSILIYRQVKIATENVKIATDTYEASTQKTKEEQKWKKAEFIANQAKYFYSDKRVERVIYMLDWGQREFSVTNLGENPILFLHESSKTWAENEHLNQKYIVTNKYVILADTL
ncbi:MAG: hypothetical protein DLM68_01740 [Hyphomicrobiales bacterium]|nr:MAG: hypothetical protein DLM68_01740 [Hyphomicrobiales bacterium]